MPNNKYLRAMSGLTSFSISSEGTRLWHTGAGQDMWSASPSCMRTVKYRSQQTEQNRCKHDITAGTSHAETDSRQMSHWTSNRQIVWCNCFIYVWRSQLKGNRKRLFNIYKTTYAATVNLIGIVSNTPQVNHHTWGRYVDLFVYLSTSNTINLKLQTKVTL